MVGIGQKQTIVSGNKDLEEMLEKARKPFAIALQYTTVSLLAYLIAFYTVGAAPGQGNLNGVGAMWAVISGIIVFQATWATTIGTASLRILGSFIGAVVSATFLSLLPFSALGMAAMIGLTVLICMALGIPGHARLAAITVTVIMVFSTLNPDVPPVINAALRFCEVIIGSVVAVAVFFVWTNLFKNGRDKTSQGPIERTCDKKE
jgi:uncharacterized membrane protein YccC